MLKQQGRNPSANAFWDRCRLQGLLYGLGLSWLLTVKTAHEIILQAKEHNSALLNAYCT
jgi:hypothetical protein